MNNNQIIEAWNAQTDLQNQWGALGEDEKVEFAFSLGAAESKAEIERLKAELYKEMCKVERKDTLLRQALEALEKTRAFHQQNWSSEETTPKLTRDTIAAIKQHLGEV